MTAFGSLYTTIIDPIDTGSTLLYYIEATDQFGQIRSKGSATLPYEYGVPAEVLDELDGLDEIQGNIEDIYANNELYVGMGSIISLWVLIKLIKLRGRRKSKK